MDERAYIENILESPALGKKPSETLGRVAKYYRANGYNSSDITRMVESFLLKCNPEANIVKWQSLIDKVVRASAKYGLVSISGINITQSEIDKIQMLPGKTLQKLMFALLCVAKYCNEINPNNNNWVNKSDKEIFAMAGIKATIKKQSLMINDLWSAGYIAFSNVVDNININVKIVDNTSDTVLVISDYRNLGNQYLKYQGEPYIECSCCGAVVKKKSNSQKYCSDCASVVNLQKATDRYYSLKN